MNRSDLFLTQRAISPLAEYLEDCARAYAAAALKRTIDPVSLTREEVTSMKTYTVSIVTNGFESHPSHVFNSATDLAAFFRSEKAKAEKGAVTK